MVSPKARNVRITAEILCTKAILFYEKLTEKNDFMTSKGWYCKFKDRYGIKYLKDCGERVSSLCVFQEKFLQVIMEMGLSEDQIYV